MANRAKAKGDRAERDAVRYLLETCRDLCLPKAQRLLGAGRAEDVGDLYVFADVAVQVRAYKMDSIGAAVRSSARDSIVQADNGDMDYALGLVPFPRARPGTVKWLACVQPEAWPTGAPEGTIPFALISRTLTWVRDDDGPHGFLAYPRDRRIALLSGGDCAPVLVAPFEAWLVAYRQATGRPAPATPDIETPDSETLGAAQTGAPPTAGVLLGEVTAADLAAAEADIEAGAGPGAGSGSGDSEEYEDFDFDLAAPGARVEHEMHVDLADLAG